MISRVVHNPPTPLFFLLSQRYVPFFPRNLTSPRPQRNRTPVGKDVPEDVAGGLQHATQLSWKSPIRLCMLIADAPCHGSMYHSCRDNYPTGCPKGLDPSKLLYTLQVCERPSAIHLHNFPRRLTLLCGRVLNPYLSVLLFLVLFVSWMYFAAATLLIPLLLHQQQTFATLHE